MMCVSYAVPGSMDSRKATFVGSTSISGDINRRGAVNFDIRAPKKEIARTKLLESLYSRGPIISRSQTFVLPNTGYFGLGLGGPTTPGSKVCEGKRRGSSKPATGLTTRSAPLLNYKSQCHKLDTTFKSLQKPRNSDVGNYSEPSYSKGTLGIDCSSNSSSGTIEPDAMPSDIYKYIMTKRRIQKHDDANNPIRMKYRPVTPGLMKALDEMKIPSRSATELWVNSQPNEKRSYHDQYYKIGRIETTQLYGSVSKQKKATDSAFIYKK